jgi:hypothetical protein
MLCTAVLHELRRRGRRKLWVMTCNPSLFDRNKDVDAVISRTAGLPEFGRRLRWNIRNPLYNTYDQAADRDVVDPDRHIISVMCSSAGIQGPISLRPYLSLSPEERVKGRRVDRQIAVQSSGMSANYAMLNKQWYPERFASVVAALRDKYNFVQLGSPTDPPLEGVLDLRGKTTFRESAAVLAESLVFVGNVGFLMHLARAVDCRSVIVYGGRESPGQSGYSCNENLFSPMPCGPCWLRNRCAYDRECMKRIQPEEVIQGIERQVARHGTMPETDSDVIGG